MADLPKEQEPPEGRIITDEERRELVRGLVRRRQLIQHLSAQTPATPEELEQMPNFLGPAADLLRTQWLRIHRTSTLSRFLSGEGDSPLDEPDVIVGQGKQADMTRRATRSATRRSAFINGYLEKTNNFLSI